MSVEYSEFTFNRNVKHLPLYVKKSLQLDIDTIPHDGWKYRFSNAAITTTIARNCTVSIDGLIFTSDNIRSITLTINTDSGPKYASFQFERQMTKSGTIYHSYVMRISLELDLPPDGWISFMLEEGNTSSSEGIRYASSPSPPLRLCPKFEICISTNSVISKSIQ